MKTQKKLTIDYTPNSVSAAPSFSFGLVNTSVITSSPTITVAGPSTGTITGLAYQSSSISIPVTGAVYDAVSSQPVVKSGTTQLTNIGQYSISGAGTTTGSVYVGPNATAGTYTISYTQGPATADTTTIQVGQFISGMTMNMSGSYSGDSTVNATAGCCCDYCGRTRRHCHLKCGNMLIGLPAVEQKSCTPIHRE